MLLYVLANRLGPYVPLAREQSIALVTAVTRAAHFQVVDRHRQRDGSLACRSNY